MNALKKRLLEYYKQLYKEKSDEYKGACKVSGKLNLSQEEHGPKYWKLHKLLQELQSEGYLEQNKGSGFKLKKSLKQE